ncbi:hypothetical protein SKAU_G00203180 [Synaphobranchus kaupii]|uniref:Uncharacterized protein n=1 Tax=Synaphobranchus kaupii TaxID=118154 RepID=A0A9Q1FFX3_SYNKA|nr:hypothetical protein SKAU_G00203180 [Synaphobranchus kaupii]
MGVDISVEWYAILFEPESSPAVEPESAILSTCNAYEGFPSLDLRNAAGLSGKGRCFSSFLGSGRAWQEEAVPGQREIICVGRPRGDGRLRISAWKEEPPPFGSRRLQAASSDLLGEFAWSRKSRREVSLRSQTKEDCGKPWAASSLDPENVPAEVPGTFLKLFEVTGKGAQPPRLPTDTALRLALPRLCIVLGTTQEEPEWRLANRSLRGETGGGNTSERRYSGYALYPEKAREHALMCPVTGHYSERGVQTEAGVWSAPPPTPELHSPALSLSALHARLQLWNSPRIVQRGRNILSVRSSPHTTPPVCGDVNARGSKQAVRGLTQFRQTSLTVKRFPLPPAVAHRRALDCWTMASESVPPVSEARRQDPGPARPRGRDAAVSRAL